MLIMYLCEILTSSENYSLKCGRKRGRWSRSHEFCTPGLEAKRDEGFEDVAHTGLPSAARPRPCIGQGVSCVNRDLHVCY